jgi:thiamine biosynthesis lipoprotein
LHGSGRFSFYLFFAMRRTLVPHLDTAPLPPALGGVVHTLAGCTMGTSWSVKVVADAERALLPLQQAIQQELDTVVAQMSPWETGSDLSRFNQAPLGSWQTLPAEFFKVLQCALQVAQESDGAYDPTAGALVNLWGFGPAQRHDEDGFTPPSPRQLEAARNFCGWHRLWLDPATQRVQQPGDIYLDLSAIAKGFGVDQVARRLQQLGHDSFLVEVGGELRGQGLKPDGQPWWVALEQAPAEHADAGGNASDIVAALLDWSVATSGDYRRYFKNGGIRYSHTIDPRTGLPIRHNLASVTVLHQQCMLADAWSTALGVMGAEDGLAYANRHQLCALFVTRTGNSNDSGDGNNFSETMSDAMKDLLQ